MHEHHVIPQCRGGTDGPTVILCPTDHNKIHAEALHIISKIRNPKNKKEPKTYWKSEREEQNAKPLVEQIVKAFLSPEPINRTHSVIVNLTTPEFQDFKLLAGDLDLSQEETLRYCIRFVVRQRGLKNEKQVQSQLWFLPSSGKGKSF
jgi:hypothetical protein